jgi:hypothetical protein
LELLLEDPQLQGTLIKNTKLKHPDMPDMYDKELVNAVLQRLETEGYIEPDYDSGARKDLSALRVPGEVRDNYLEGQ